VTHFIVKQTLGRILRKAKTGDEILKVKLLDQAAGSGSFLIEAFGQFRDAYREFKREYQERAKQGPFEMQLVQPEWFDPEKAILQNNIYGVDLDPQAVEITTLSLELKAVRTRERTPYLGEHIKRGNSIVNHTADELLEEISEGELKQLLGEDWRAKWQYKHPFKYSEGFKEIMDNGGFHIVIGNPPYNNMRDPELKIEQAYCEKFHDDIFRGNSDILFYFIESGLSVLKQGGLLGLIVARYFMKSEEADRLREYILNHSKIRYIVDTRNVQVFGKVNVLTCIIVLERDDSTKEEKSSHKIKVVNVKNTFRGTLEQLFERINQNIDAQEISDDWIDVFQKEQGELSDEPWTLEPPAVGHLLQKMEENAWPLSELTHPAVGFVTGMNEGVSEKKLLELAAHRLSTSPEKLRIYGRRISLKDDDSKSLKINELGEVDKKEGVFIISDSEVTQLGLEKELLVPLVMPSEIQRYAFKREGRLLIKTDRDTEINKFPRIKAHLARFRQQLEQRDAMPECKWYGISLLKNREFFETAKEKIMVPAYATGNRFALDEGNYYYCINTSYIIVPKNESPVDIRYILAVLNSRLMEFYHKKIGKLKREGYYEYFAEQLRRLPIKKIDMKKRLDKDIHNGIVDLVIRLIDNKNRLLILEKTFAECSALYPVDEKLSRLRTYYEYEGIQPTVLGGFNTKRGTVYIPKISREKDKIRLLIDYLPEGGESEEGIIAGTPALDLKFQDEELHDYIYYSLRKFTAETTKRMLGKGNILRVLLSEISVPCFVSSANQQENTKIIRKIVNQFRVRTKGLLTKDTTLEQLEERIQALDNEVEAEVRNLYGITKDEEGVIEGELL
jgi:hypothetical protein